MNKIFNIILLSIVGILGGLFAVLIWNIGFIFIFINEVPGTKDFMKKLHQLNIIIKDEFKKVFGIFRKVNGVR